MRKKSILFMLTLMAVVALTSCGDGKVQKTDEESVVVANNSEEVMEKTSEDEGQGLESSEEAVEIDWLEVAKNCFYGTDGQEQDNQKAKEALESLLKEGESGEAYYYLGCLAMKEKNYASALDCFEKAEELENDLALVQLGRMCQEGYGVAVDMDKAREYYQRALDHGCVEANNGFGDFYQSGIANCDEDFEEAKSFFESALGVATCN